MTNHGAKHVLNQESPDFPEKLQALIDELKPSVLFECVGGDLPGDVFIKMPPKSIMVVYGNLTKQRITFEP